MTAALLSLAIGFVSGLRTLTSLAALGIARGGPIAAVIFGVAALLEYVADASPKIPSRLAFPSIVLRPVSGAIAGGWLATHHGLWPAAGAALGLIGAFAGTYGGAAARSAAIRAIGAIPAALAEDGVAIVIAAIVVTR